MTLNHYAINQVVGGKMVAGSRARFGNFGLLGTLGTVLKNRPRPNAKVTFDIAADQKILNAFIKVSDGYSPESLLLHAPLANKFHSEARRLGIHASAADMNRRLINIRKNKARYSQFGLAIPTATKTSPQPSIVPGYAHVIEFALSRLRSRYGVSIDDILIDPDLTTEYEKMVHSVAPNLDSLSIRLAALYIRKTRYVAKKEEVLFESLDIPKIQSAFSEIGNISEIDITEVPSSEGIIELLEDNRYLYISRIADLHASVEQMRSPSSLAFMANDFWQPKPESLSIRIFKGPKYLEVPIKQWQLKLISENKPVFNYPVAA
jgi:hypothetical protein